MATTRFNHAPWITAFALGFLVWIAFSSVMSHREAWDYPLYFVALLPALSIYAGIAGWLSPRHAWLVAPALAAGQFAALVVDNSGVANLWPLTLVVLAVLHLPALLLALLGSWLRLRSTRTHRR